MFGWWEWEYACRSHNFRVAHLTPKSAHTYAHVLTHTHTYAHTYAHTPTGPTHIHTQARRVKEWRQQYKCSACFHYFQEPCAMYIFVITLILFAIFVLLKCVSVFCVCVFSMVSLCVCVFVSSLCMCVNICACRLNMCVFAVSMYVLCMPQSQQCVYLYERMYAS